MDTACVMYLVQFRFLKLKMFALWFGLDWKRKLKFSISTFIQSGLPAPAARPR